LATTVGLIAGLGRFPLEVARGARRSGHRVAAVALRKLSDPALEAEADSFTWLYLGELNRLFAFFRDAGVEKVVMVGKVPKTFLWKDPSAFRPDAQAITLLKRLADRKDDSILGSIAQAIEEEGFPLLGQADLAPELWAPEGVIGKISPTEEQLGDIAFGWPIAKAIGNLDIGQTVVVRGRAVLALEAIEGTDAAIRRGCALGEKGASVVKVAKPKQDPRFDVPTVGRDTLATLIECGAGALAVEAGRTVILDREAVARGADEHGISIVGIDAERPSWEEPS
jgi:DUF1009 family protein